MSLRMALCEDRFDIRDVNRFCLITRAMTTSLELYFLIQSRNKDAASVVPDRAVIVNSEGRVDYTVSEDTLLWRHCGFR